MLDQAVQDYGQMFGGGFPILKRHAVKHNIIDVETSATVVRIIQADNGSITLAGWRRTDHKALLTGVWTALGGWRVGTGTGISKSNLFPKA